MESIWPLGAAGRGMQVWDVATGARVWVSPTQFIDPSCRLESGREAPGQLWQ